MIRPAVVVALVALAGASMAFADEAEDRLRAAEQRAASGDPGEARAGIDALEELGRQRPQTIWTDDAWAVAARFAENARDFERAHRDLEQVIATSSDEAVLRRAHNDLKRLAGVAGATGQFSEAAAAHERLAAKLSAERGDPRGLLGELEAVVRAHPGYPRAPIAMIQIAHGWEREGETERAASWLLRARDGAVGIDRERAAAELARLYIRAREIDQAHAAISAVEDPRIAAKLRLDLASAEGRKRLTWTLWGVLAVIVVAAIIELRRGAGSWRMAMRRLARPPVEVVFFAPIAAVIVAVAQTGNPLVARAVLAISIVGVVAGWISGALLEGRSASLVRTIVHALVAVIAIVSASYLAIDHGRMIDLVVETWRNGPGLR